MNGKHEQEKAVELDHIIHDHLHLQTHQNMATNNSLSSREMDSLTALCDTILPSINKFTLFNYTDDNHQSLHSFFTTSSSMARTPQRIGGLILGKLQHPKVFLIRVTLWVLSTRIGTFILCGWGSLSSHFPYFQKFSQISDQKKREDIILSWSLSYFSLLRVLFFGLKLLTLLVFFSQVNENNENVSWKAIGYCGPPPDEDFKATQTDEEEDDEEEKAKKKTEDKFGPLYKGIINLNHPPHLVIESLRLSGFPVSIPSSEKLTETTSAFNPSLIIKCDAVVVGSGSGGGVVAGVLAQSGYKVLVIEKGNYVARNNLSLLEGPSMDQMYLGNGLLATDDMGVIVLAGSTVGGGSAVNWSASIRTPKHVRKDWSENYALEVFDSRSYREALDIVCERMGVQSEVEEEGFNNAILRKGCEELGYPLNNIPRNSPPDHYCGWCCFGCKDGKKKGTSETWLVDLVHSGNGVILPECEAVQVLHRKGKGRERSTATGVAFEFQNSGVKQICIVESKVTIVACGAICTPALLKRSGLKNPNIGKNLHLHPVALGWGYFPDDKPSFDVWPESEKRSYQGGIMTAMSTVVGNFETSGYGAVIQTPSLHPGMFSTVMPWTSGLDIKMRMCKFSRTAHLIAIARDQGSGEVASPHSISYKMDRADEENLRRGLEKILRILTAAGAEEIGTHDVRGKTLNVKTASSHEFERFLREETGSRPLGDLTTPICSAHQMGSCRMGVEPKGSAVNETGETWEVEGLYVADTSVFPTALGVNPMVTVQAIAYCTAQSVLQVLRRKKEAYF